MISCWIGRDISSGFSFPLESVQTELRQLASDMNNGYLLGSMSRLRTSRAKDGEQPDPYEFSDSEDTTVQVHTPKTPDAGREKMETDADSSKPSLSGDRLKAFKAALLDAFKAAHAQSIAMPALMDAINKNNESPFSQGEVKAALELMEDANHIMVSENIVFLI
ncbi:DNA replication licensing factor MCM3 [Pelobates cultripes]|uniref:DNA replication licensing factor MCM3 n=1 Tax=Pelobates cultripes TaxID=61616 RepID=A0AAD1R9F1_PELCU|nr:DNA replication licensing factor MCM3 [Pelobates cultripes]